MNINIFEMFFIVVAFIIAASIGTYIKILDKRKYLKKEKMNMKIEFEVSCLGYSVGGHSSSFDIEIEDWETEGMPEEEKEKYIEKCIYGYILENLDYGYEIILS